VKFRAVVLSRVRISGDNVLASLEVPDFDLTHEEKANFFARRMEGASQVLLGMQSKVLSLDLTGMAGHCAQIAIAGIQLRNLDASHIAIIRELLERYNQNAKVIE